MNDNFLIHWNHRAHDAPTFLAAIVASVTSTQMSEWLQCAVLLLTLVLLVLRIGLIIKGGSKKGQGDG